MGKGKRASLVDSVYKIINKSYRPVDKELELLDISLDVKWKKHFITKDYLHTISDENLGLCLRSLVERKEKRDKRKNKRRKGGRFKKKENKYSFLRKSAKKSSTHSTVYLILMWKGMDKDTDSALHVAVVSGSTTWEVYGLAINRAGEIENCKEDKIKHCKACKTRNVTRNRRCVNCGEKLQKHYH